MPQTLFSLGGNLQSRHFYSVCAATVQRQLCTAKNYTHWQPHHCPDTDIHHALGQLLKMECDCPKWQRIWQWSHMQLICLPKICDHHLHKMSNTEEESQRMKLPTSSSSTWGKPPSVPPTKITPCRTQEANLFLAVVKDLDETASNDGDLLSDDVHRVDPQQQQHFWVGLLSPGVDGHAEVKLWAAGRAGQHWQGHDVLQAGHVSTLQHTPRHLKGGVKCTQRVQQDWRWCSPHPVTWKVEWNVHREFNKTEDGTVPTLSPDRWSELYTFPPCHLTDGVNCTQSPTGLKMVQHTPHHMTDGVNCTQRAQQDWRRCSPHPITWQMEWNVHREPNRTEGSAGPTPSLESRSKMCTEITPGWRVNFFPWRRKINKRLLFTMAFFFWWGGSGGGRLRVNN